MMKQNGCKLLISLFLLTLVCLPVAAITDDFERGRTAFSQGDYNLAQQYFRRALRANPANATYRYYLAQSLVQTRMLDQAQVEYQRIIQSSPFSREAKYAKVALVQIKDYIDNTLSPRWRSLNSNLSVGVTETKSRADVGDNYIDKVTEKGQVIRWQKESMPLKIYLETNPRKVQSFNNAYVSAVKKGIEKWSKATDGLISFTYVKDPAQADVKFTWREILDTKLVGSDAGTAYTAGVTTPEYSGNELYAMAIVLTTTDPNGKPHKIEDIEKVTTHELGHGLGIMGHSTDQNDIMYPNSMSDGSVSKRDSSTMTLLYDLKPDISNFRVGGETAIASNKSSDANVDVLGSKSERIQTEIEEIEEAIKNNPKSDINHINLGNLYSDEGDYEGAIREYKTALKLNPKNEIAYSNLGAMYLNTNKPYDALKVYKESIRLDPTRPRPYLQVAIIAEQINQHAEALTYLDKYLALNPRAKEDPEVVNLQKRLSF